MRPWRIAIILGLAATLGAADRPVQKPAAPAGPPSEDLSIDSALVRVIEEVEVPTRVEGVLIELNVREGQMVARGELLARIEDTEPRLTLQRSTTEFEIARRQAKNGLKILAAKKASDLAASELRRAKVSLEKSSKSVADSELDHLQFAAEKARLEVEQATEDQKTAELTAELKDSERQLAQAAVDRRRIAAPLTGMVVQVYQHAGEWLAPGKSLLRVLRVDRLRVEGLVAVKKLLGDPTGRRATLLVDLPGRPASVFEGVVVFVSPEVNPVNGQVQVWAEVENHDLLLRPGLQGKLTILPEPPQTAKRDTQSK
ncbi:MAG: HlyD family efflux transporter periplasmic adaptor subunit [Planctomycetaceae bacterium]|nr:HlyD family efflux transporter periplasmic adaptor subunit [Planctomycetaceae bacterium]